MLGGVPGVNPGTVVVIGGGVTGKNAARTACGLGAKVFLLENRLERLRYLSDVMPKNCFLYMSNPPTIRRLLKEADVVVGAVLIPGSKAPKPVTKGMLKKMKKGAVIVDIAIDQGGCFETSRPTRHSNPVYIVDDIVHYCVNNMPGAVPKTSTYALTNATFPYVLELANNGWAKAASENSDILSGLNLVKGKITCKGIAEAFRLKFVEAKSILQLQEQII